MNNFIYKINPQDSSVERINTSLTIALSSIFGNDQHNLIEVNDDDSSSTMFIKSDGLDSNAFFKFNEFLIGGVGVVIFDTNTPDISERIKWIPTNEARAELLTNSFLAESEFNSCGIKTNRSGPFSFDIIIS